MVTMTLAAPLTRLDADVTRQHPDKEVLRQAWTTDADPWAARAFWSLRPTAWGSARGCTSPFAPIWIGEMVRRNS